VPTGAVPVGGTSASQTGCEGAEFRFLDGAPQVRPPTAGRPPRLRAWMRSEPAQRRRAAVRNSGRTAARLHRAPGWKWQRTDRRWRYCLANRAASTQAL